MRLIYKCLFEITRPLWRFTNRLNRRIGKIMIYCSKKIHNMD